MSWRFNAAISNCTKLTFADVWIAKIIVFEIRLMKHNQSQTAKKTATEKRLKTGLDWKYSELIVQIMQFEWMKRKVRNVND